MIIEGIEIKTEGSWTWVYGNTYPIKEALKAQGLRWSPKRKAWYSKRIVDVEIETKEVKEPNGRIETTAEEAIRVKDGIYKGITTGTLYDKNGTVLTKTTKLLTTADAKKNTKEVLAEGKITNLSKKEYGRIAHLYKYGKKSYMIEIEAGKGWGQATKRKLYKTERGARKVFDEFNVEPVEIEQEEKTPSKMEKNKKENFATAIKGTEGYNKLIESYKKEYGILIPI